MTTIEKIRTEIERLTHEYEKNLESLYPHYEVAFADLLSFLSTLESEKPMQEGLEEEINKAMKSDLHPEEISDYDFCCIARHFAQWGAEHIANPGKTSSGSSEIPNNPECLADAGKTLDEAAEKADDEGIVGFECGFCITAKHPRDYFIAGAKWAMGRGVKGEVKDFCFVREVNYASAKIEFDTIPELKEGEEVIVQIRKKNQ